MINSRENQHTLDTLFSALRQELPAQKYIDLEDKIVQIWQQAPCESSSETIHQVKRAMQSKQHTEALTLLYYLLERLPQFAEAWHLKALAHYERGELRLSLDHNKEALKHEPRHFRALSQQARIFMLIGDYRAALKCFERLAVIYPKRKSLSDRILQLRAQLTQH